VTIYQKVGEESIGWADTLYNIGIVYKNQNKVKSAFSSYNRAVTIYQKVGKESIGWADALYNIGNVYDDYGKLK